MKSKFVKKLSMYLIIAMLSFLVIGKLILTNHVGGFLFYYGVTVTSLTLLIFAFSSQYKDPSEGLMETYYPKMRKPLISCVVAVRNEGEILSHCIDSLVNQTYPNKEIIVVDDNSEERTKKILNKYRNNPRVKILTLKENLGKKGAIGEGLKIAKGEFFVFTDSDCIISPDAVSKIIAVMVKDKDVGAVSGHGRALNSSENTLTKVIDTWYETQYAVKKGFESVFGCVSCISGPLAVFRRAAIYNYIPAWVNDRFLGSEFRFATDRQLTSYVLGNEYIGQKLKEKYKDSDFVKKENYHPRKWKLLYCKSARVKTVVPNTIKRALLQQIRWKKSFIRNFFFLGNFYWRKGNLTALKFYLVALFTFIGPFIAFHNIIYLPVMHGNIYPAIYYLTGILFIGSLYGVIYRIEDEENPSLWKYRPLMSILSTTMFSFVIFYSAVTIKKMAWHRFSK